MEETAIQVAGPGARFAGALIDGLVLLVVLGVAWVVGGDAADGDGWIGVGLFAVALGYHTVGVAVWGRTVGKLLVGTRVIAHDGGRPTFLAAALRALLPSAGALVGTTIGLPGLDVAWSFVVYWPLVRSADRRGLHDRAAGTLVVVDRVAR